MFLLSQAEGGDVPCSPSLTTAAAALRDYHRQHLSSSTRQVLLKARDPAIPVLVRGDSGITRSSRFSFAVIKPIKVRVKVTQQVHHWMSLNV